MPTTPEQSGLLSRRASQRLEARKSAGSTAGVAGTAVTPTPLPKPKEAAVEKQAQAAHRAAVQDDARQRVAAAWTTAKTLLPSAPHKAQQRLAAALCTAPTPLVREAFRAVARLSYHSKNAQAFEEGVKQELNVLIENEGMMTKLRDEVFKELNQDDPAKVASKKTAAPGDEEGTTTDAPPEAEAAPGTEGTPDAVPPPTPGEFTDAAPAGDAAIGDMGDPGMGMDDVPPANGAADAGADAQGLLDKIQQTEQAIGEIESQVSQAEEEALDLASIFNPDLQADKAQNLANEGEGMDIDMDEADAGDFAPSDTEDMMGAADFGAPSEGMTDADFFKDASGPDPMAALLGGKKAADVDVDPGEMQGFFKSDLAGDPRDAEADHTDDLLGEVLSQIDQPDMVQKRDVQDKFEPPPAVDKKAAAKPTLPRSEVAAQTLQASSAPKAAAAAPAAAPAKPKSSIKSVGAPTGASKQAGVDDRAISRLIFGEDE